MTTELGPPTPGDVDDVLDDLSEAAPEPRIRPLKRIKPREFKTSDIGVLALSALSSFSIVWILFTQLTLLSGPLGFVVMWLPVFLGLYWFVNRQLFNRQVAVDRLIGSIVTVERS